MENKKSREKAAQPPRHMTVLRWGGSGAFCSIWLWLNQLQEQKRTANDVIVSLAKLAD
ncbi:MAG: hypothetical protein WBB69_03405 [Anaerolineales bacterium]